MDMAVASGLGRSKRVIIVGAGWAGLAAAKTYLEVDPKIDLTIVDADRTLGGVWSADRIYPGLLADSPVGFFDFSDLPMESIVGMKKFEDLPAQKVYDYLYSYAEKFHLLERLRLSSTVTKISRNDDLKSWNVTIQPTGEVLQCDKLLVATGLASKPNIPDIATESFSSLVMHSKNIGVRHAELTSEKVNRVTVYGGSKSAVDCIILCNQAGKKVDWIIRDVGNGPGMMTQVRKGGRHGIFFMGRWKQFLMPSMFTVTGFAYNFLHSGKSRLGTWIREKIWSKAGHAPFKMEPYKTGSENIRKLKPEVDSALWQTAAVNALHGDRKFLRDLHEGKNIIVHRASITSMSGSKISLSNGVTLDSDVVVFATGWTYSTTMFEPQLALELGLPTPLQHQDASTASHWQPLIQETDEDLLSQYAALQKAPDFHKKELTHTPFRLYRRMVPRSLAIDRDRSLIFLGMVTNLTYAIFSEVSALWAVSWMEGLLDEKSLPESQDEIDREIARFNSWSARRYLARGRKVQVAGGEIQDMTDLLMRDMGLESHRKKGYLEDLFVTYSAQDYKGIVQEKLELAKRSRDQCS